MRGTKLKDTPEANRRSLLEKLGSLATIVAALGAVYFGYYQNSINHKLSKMSEVVAVTAVVENENSGEFLVRNTGKLNLYLAGFRFGEEGIDRVFSRSRLIAVSAGGDPGYPIQPGKEQMEIINRKGSATLTLFFKDELERKWVSEFGLFKAGERGSSYARICSYETFGENWQRQPAESVTTPAGSAEYIEGAYFERGVRRRY